MEAMNKEQRFEQDHKKHVADFSELLKRTGTYPDPRDIAFIINEIQLFKPNSYRGVKSCDTIVGYYPGLIDLYELKHSHHYDQTAETQLDVTEEFLLDVLGLTVRDKSIVIYDHNGYEVRKVK